MSSACTLLSMCWTLRLAGLFPTPFIYVVKELKGISKKKAIFSEKDYYCAIALKEVFIMNFLKGALVKE